MTFSEFGGGGLRKNMGGGCKVLGLAFLCEGGGVWRKKWGNGGVPWDKFSKLGGGGG